LQAEPVAVPPAAPVDKGDISPGSIFAPLLTLSSIGGFLLYYCGLTRAKNCAHTSMLLLMGVLFGFLGFWIAGFAIQTGGIGDAHAALMEPLAATEKSALDHELGLTTMGHHWGVMGNSGFFLATDETTRNGISGLFLVQAVLLMLAVAAALGAALERGRVLAMTVISFLTGAMIYPLFANWVWGGGWLAELGREFGLGHGVIDLAGAGVVHETAGTLALIIALVLGPRHGRFTRNKATGIPGHNVPFTILGAVVLIIAWTASNAAALGSDSSGGSAGLAAVNVLLGAAGGALAFLCFGFWRKQRTTPARLSLGWLAGAVSLCGGPLLSSAFAPDS